MQNIPMKFASYKTSIVDLREGINENVSSLELKAGELIDCKNYMIAEGGYGGYRSIKGFERIDGTMVPSKYPSVVLYLTDCDLEILEGQPLTGVTTGAIVMALEDGEIISGSYLEANAVVHIECLIVTGELERLEDVVSPSGVVGNIDEVNNLLGGTANYNLAIKYANALVVEVGDTDGLQPCEGPILGLHIYNNKMYAFRKKASVDEIVMFVEDETIGWAEVDTSADPIVYDPLVLPEFHFVNYNFYASDVAGPGSTLVYTMYWVDGVNQTRSFDGSNVVTIDNPGMSAQTLDAPTLITAHNFHLFLAYRGGSLQHSALGDPGNFTGLVGAREIGLGTEITNLVSGVESSLVIFLDEGINVLLGNTIDDFVLDTFSTQSGALSRTALRLLGTVFFLDDRGLSTIEAVQEYGDYGANSISQRFKTTLLRNKHNVTTALTSRDLNQYRLFFNDKTGIVVSFEGKEFKGATFIEYPKVVNVAAQGEDDEHSDYIIFGSDEETGYVYKMDSGNTFDGTEISCRLATAFYHYGSPRQWKAFKRATFEVSAEDEQMFYMKVEFNYNELGNPRTIWHTPYIYRDDGDAIWAESDWGTMVYGAGTVTNRVPLYLQGVGTNMSYRVVSNDNYREQHIIQNIITDFEPIGRRV